MKSDIPTTILLLLGLRDCGCNLLVGYVSDEMNVAIPNATLEISGASSPIIARSGPSGAVYADCADGEYEVVIACAGYGSKRARATLSPERPHLFRLQSDRPLGYVWPKSVTAGDRAELRVSSGEAYTLDLFRYGWEKEHVRFIGRFDDHPPHSLRQILPDADVAKTGTGWNRLGYSYPPSDPRQLVKAPERSGLYYFHLKTDSGRFFSFPWVVAPGRPSSDTAVLASNITWNAYNDFGGRSNYVASIKLPDQPTVNPRQEEIWFTDPAEQPWVGETYDPLSFDRPEPLNVIDETESITDLMLRRGAEHVAPAEWRLLGWLEREGFAYDLYAETQLHSGVLRLDDYRVLILSTHPEYWTKLMYDRLNSWVRERGGKVMYLGGNGINCEVEMLDEQTMVVHNTNLTGVPEAERDDRFGRRNPSAAGLLGIGSTFAGYETGAPYRILEPDHWVFRGLGAKHGDLVGTRSLDMRCPGGASGHETDKIVTASPTYAKLLAKGTNPDEGGGEMVLVEHPDGGTVFSVGSISYTCAVAVDPAISRITANVLGRFLGSEVTGGTGKP